VLAKKFGWMQTDLGRVKKRMRTQRYPHDDKLQLLVLQAFDAIQELRMHVHYLGCAGAGGSGNTDPPKFEGVPLPPSPHDQAESDGNERRGDEECAEAETLGPRHPRNSRD
jgi:hypothetical protein